MGYLESFRLQSLWRSYERMTYFVLLLNWNMTI
ncbi:hypothetical protein PSFL111601_19325 [Pseudomonas floridensis]